MPDGMNGSERVRNLEGAEVGKLTTELRPAGRPEG